MSSQHSSSCGTGEESDTLLDSDSPIAADMPSSASPGARFVKIKLPEAFSQSITFKSTHNLPFDIEHTGDGFLRIYTNLDDMAERISDVASEALKEACKEAARSKTTKVYRKLHEYSHFFLLMLAMIVIQKGLHFTLQYYDKGHLGMAMLGAGGLLAATHIIFKFSKIDLVYTP
ncbi:hypothetical protein H2200_009698 [Cladophialophora chaetospira]|uniref:Uncharacterized protein n=1 Tax=Cladophialophora chaetospira TaxID=386627 RepID=A0AA38X2X2_9EURO|nr:hypothetical protein H2200_009698 [Cladophialophora chaetospira]